MINASFAKFVGWEPDQQIEAVVQEYWEARLQPIPIRADGSKAPALGTGQVVRSRDPANRCELRWFKGKGIGLIAGRASGGLESIDFDKPDLFAPWRALVEDQLPGLMERLVIIQTPRRDAAGESGRHVCYRCDQPGGNTTLAQYVTADGEIKVAIETRGEGGYIVAPGSPPSCHESGRCYVVQAGNIFDIPHISMAERDVLFSCARVLTEWVDDEPAKLVTNDNGKGHAAPYAPPSEGEVTTPWDAFDLHGDIRPVLQKHGWTKFRDATPDDDNEHWTRPGKQGGTSATLNSKGCFYCFTHNGAPFKAHTGYYPFNVYKLLEHGGDGRAAARELRRQGLGGRDNSDIDFSGIDRPTDRSGNGQATEQAAKQPAADETEQAAAPEQPKANAPAPYEPFPTEILPPAIREFIEAGAASLDGDAAFIALPLLSSLAATIGNTRRVQPKAGWTEPCVIWSITVGRSGTMKSPGWDLGTCFILQRQTEAFERYNRDLLLYEHDVVMHEADLQEWKSRGGKKRGEPAPPAPRQPTPDRCSCSDATMESVVTLLDENRRGVLVACDELAAFFGSFDAYRNGHGGDAARWLSMHRAGPVTSDRKTGKRFIHIPRAAASITGCIQPETLRLVMGGGGKGRDDTKLHVVNGMLARFLVAYPPLKAKKWSDKVVPTSVKQVVADIFARLFELTFAPPKNDLDFDSAEPVNLPLSHVAQVRFAEFYDANNKEQVALPSDLAAAWSKAEGYAVRLALLFTLVENPDATVVDLAAMEAGIELTRWFEREASRVYATIGGSVESEEARKSRERQRLFEWICKQGRFVTSRDLVRGVWQFRNDTEKAEAALQDLVTANFGQWEPDKHGLQGGRPARKFIPFIDTTLK